MKEQMQPTITALLILIITTNTRNVSSLSSQKKESRLMDEHLHCLLHNRPFFRGGDFVTSNRIRSATMTSESKYDEPLFQSGSKIKEPSPYWPIVEDFYDSAGYEDEEEYDEYDEEEDSVPLPPPPQALQEEEKIEAKPVIYRYFGRTRSPSSNDASIPFILLGPDVDHWKSVGRALSQYGYNVIACQTSAEEMKKGEGSGLISEILQSLQWKKAVVIACDSYDASLAIESALELRDNIVGLVLCGDLRKVQKNYKTLLLPEQQGHHLALPSSLDELLLFNVSCPSMIIWEGGDVDNGKRKERYEMDYMHTNSGLRRTIIGGGTRPHRCLPDQFAWTLARFLQQRVTPYHSANDIQDRREEVAAKEHQLTSIRIGDPSTRLLLPFFQDTILTNFFSSDSETTFLVSGRIIATGILYMSVASVALYQYQNLQLLWNGIVTCLTKASFVQRRTVQWILSILMKDLTTKVNFLKRCVCFVIGSRNQAVMSLSSLKNETDKDDDNSMKYDFENDRLCGLDVYIS